MSNKVNFTPKQQQIIKENEKNLLVSANAGSGKTSVMIERVARLIEDGKTTLDRILVLTFTNNSANDMKEKLYKKLSSNPSKNCRRALFEVSGADISNIHQFCKKLIQKYFYVCGVDPSFSVVSESEALVLKDNAFEEVVKDEFFSNNQQFEDLLDDNFERRNLNSIKDMLFSIYEYLNVLDQPQKWLDNIASTSYGADIEKNKAIDVLVNDAKMQLQCFLKMFAQLKTHVENFYNNNNFDDISNNINLIENVINAKSNKDFIEKLISLKHEKRDYRKKDEIKAFRDENVNPLIDNYKKIIEKLKKNFGDQSVLEIEEFLKSSKANTEYLCKLVSLFSDKYQKLKAEKFLLDFNDLEKKALEILNDENVKKIIQKKYDYCFIDEYQDINTIQEAILNLVSKKSKYFGVGDAKQAIYGFRLCSPEIFIEKFENYKKDEKTSVATSLIKNFRSKASILNFCNKIFSVVMTEKTAQINYKETAMFETDNKEEQCSVKILVAKKLPKQNAKLPEVYSVLNHNFQDDEESGSAKLQAIICANEIANLVEKGENLGDISILSRSKNSKFIKEFFNHLSSFNIPLSANFNYNLLDCVEISIIHNLLKLINNFKDDITLVKVMLSPLFEFTNQQLYDIKQAQKEKFFYDSLMKFSENDQQVKNFINKIENLSKMAQNVTVVEFVNHVVQEFNFLDYVNKNFEEGEQNLLKYYSFLEDFALNDLSSYCNVTKNESIQIKNELSTSAQNSVLLNTIHSAKGLEYKFVFLVGCDRSIVFDDKTKQTLVSKELGVGIKAKNIFDEKTPTPVYNAIKISKKKQEFAEEIRLLYVALTRAKEKLFIVGAIDEKSIGALSRFKDDEQILKSKNYLELILRSLDQSELSSIKAKSSCDILNKGNKVAICKIFEEKELDKSYYQDENQTLLSGFNETELREIENKIVAYRETLNYKNYYLKNNVSALIKQNDEISYSNNMFSDEDKTSADVGTLYHKTLASLKYDNQEKDLYIPQDIDENHIKKYLNSPLYKSLVGKKIYKEIPFLLYEKLTQDFCESDDKVLLQGVVDLLLVENDGFTVIDFKATNASDEKIRKRYEKQLKLYAYAAEKIFSKKCKKMLIYKIFSAKVIEIN